MYNRFKGWNKVNVDLSYSGRKVKAFRWLNSNCTGRYSIAISYVNFEKEKDATFFGIAFS